MDTTIITGRICLEPKHLDSNIVKHLLVKIRQQTENACLKEHGYILKVIKIAKIIDNRISSANSDIVFTVSYLCNRLLPIVGKILKGEVCIIFNKGIFIEVCNKMKVLITADKLIGYTFDQAKMIYMNDKKIIQKGETLSVKLTGVMYSKQSFSSFGELC